MEQKDIVNAVWEAFEETYQEYLKGNCTIDEAIRAVKDYKALIKGKSGYEDDWAKYNLLHKRLVAERNRGMKTRDSKPGRKSNSCWIKALLAEVKALKDTIIDLQGQVSELAEIIAVTNNKEA